MKSTLKPYHNKLKALFAQHIQSNVETSQSDGEPITEADEPIAVGPEPTDPPAHDEKALTEEVAKQIGWRVGDEAPGRVTNRKIVNRNYVWATVRSWSDDVLVSVHDRLEWPAGSPIKCFYKGANSDGHLVFNSKEHGPKWKRRGSR
jgi:hypothetical protein